MAEAPITAAVAIALKRFICLECVVRLSPRYTHLSSQARRGDSKFDDALDPIHILSIVWLVSLLLAVVTPLS